MSLSSITDDIWRNLVFFTGDIRQMHRFPWVSWAKHHHSVEYDEILPVLSKIRYGDIGLHRDWGYLSNIAIPGFMKHAWIHTVDGITRPQIIEAVSEGVIKRSAVYPMFSDYTMILRPRDATEEERKGACNKVNRVVGTGYDVDFKFDIEEELHYYQGVDSSGASTDLVASQKYLRRYDHGFSCTELCSYAWWHKREQLRLYRTKRRGKMVILADDFINHDWEIVWLSNSITVDIAKKLGLHEEGLSMIENYLKDKQGTTLILSTTN